LYCLLCCVVANVFFFLANANTIHTIFLFLLLAGSRTLSPVHIADANPLALHRFLPKAHLVVATRNGEDVASYGPGDVPHDILESVQNSLRPAAGVAIVSPQDDATILRTAGNDGPRQADGRSPRNVSDPIRMAFQFGFFNPLFVLFSPNFDEIVASTAHESFDGRRLVAGTVIESRTWTDSRCPADSIAANLYNYNSMRTIRFGHEIIHSHSRLITVWALLIFLASHPPLIVAVKIEMDPSELPQARIKPKS